MEPDLRMILRTDALIAQLIFAKLQFYSCRCSYPSCLILSPRFHLCTSDEMICSQAEQQAGLGTVQTWWLRF